MNPTSKGRGRTVRKRGERKKGGRGGEGIKGKGGEERDGEGCVMTFGEEGGGCPV